jgi:hypothetical protein
MPPIASHTSEPTIRTVKIPNLAYVFIKMETLIPQYRLHCATGDSG